MSSFLIIVLTTLFVTSIVSQNLEKNHKKRQIYREHVSPHIGGRIPDTAFQTDRLFLNRLQKDGISIPDGIVPESRTPQVYPFLNKPVREVYRVALSPDSSSFSSSFSSPIPFPHRRVRHDLQRNRKVTPSVETTYLYPQIYGQPIFKPGQEPLYPVLKEIQLPNSQTIQKVLRAKYPDTNSRPLLESINEQKYPRIQQYQNRNVGSSLSRNNHFGKYNREELLDEFDNFFNSLNVHNTERWSGDKLKRDSTRYVRH